ncbi:MAG: hypothetical protein ABI427_15715 [Solirubrobacteraceae bacterium]
MRSGAADAPTAKAPAELFHDFIKLEGQDLFRREVHVRLDNGARYVPNGGSQGVQLLRKNVNAFEKAIRTSEDPGKIAAAQQALDNATAAVEAAGARAELPFIERARQKLTPVS